MLFHAQSKLKNRVHKGHQRSSSVCQRQDPILLLTEQLMEEESESKVVSELP